MRVGRHGEPGGRRRGLEAGACAVNDVSCLRDPRLADVVAREGAALVLMHTRGTPSDMAGFSRYPDGGYRDLVEDVCAEWQEASARALERGVSPDAIVMDPGLGFAKNARQSAELLEASGRGGAPRGGAGCDRREPQVISHGN